MNEIIASGLEIMLVGMGMVFLFLAMLIIAVNLMSAIIQRYFSQESIEITNYTSVADDPCIIAAISVAVHQYRNEYKT